MRPRQARFVTACQQLLALGVVVAALTPAASVVSLDVIGQTPGHGPGAADRPSASLSAYSRETRRPSVLPNEVVDAEVEEYALTAAPGSRVPAGSLQARTTARSTADGRVDRVVTSRPQEVTGYGAVGVTWDAGTQPGPAGRRTADHEHDHDEGLGFEARTFEDGEWSGWSELPYRDDHQPDPDSEEGRHARPGTDVLFVGQVDRVQVRAVSETAPPAGMRLAVIAPGVPAGTTTERAAIDTGAADLEQPVPAADGETLPEDGLDLQATTYTPRPKIYSREQWGANEALRDKGSLRYYEIHAGFVHHTVNANGYSRDQVPGILRSIYAYHTQSRGWSDVGYNFLVDRFGRIWEGRAGGVDRPVVGAHTLGYNDYAFAMSAIGNFETATPRDAMLQAYGSLFAWKLSLHGVDASSDRQRVGSSTFAAINGHRDAGSTACPGRYLYARLGTIRKYAEAAQRSWSGRELASDLAGTPHPDLIARRASDGMGFIIPTEGLLDVAAPKVTTGGSAGVSVLTGSPDLTGDGRGDVVVRDADGTAWVRPGTVDGFGDPVRRTSLFAGRDLVTAVGDLDGDGDNDLVGRNASTNRLNVFLGTGTGSFERRGMPGEWAGYNRLAATGDLTRDGHVDLLGRDTAGHLSLFPGTGRLELGAPIRVPGRWGGLDTISGYGDFTGDGRPDLVIRRPGEAAWVRPWAGDGSFGHRLGPITRLSGVGQVSGLGDVTGTADPDLVARRGSDLLTFAHRGTFDTGTRIRTGVDLSGANTVLNVGDWDRDGHGDIVYRTRGEGTLVLRRGNGEGRFGSATKIGGSGFRSVGLLAAVGDMTGDGWPDLMGQPSDGPMRIYPGRGLNGFRASFLAFSRISASRHVGIGRWDADGAPDSIVRRDGTLVVYRGNGPGGWTSSQSLGIDVSRFDWVVGVSDVGLGGHADLIVRGRDSGDLHLLPGTRDGLGQRRFLAESMEEYDLVG